MGLLAQNYQVNLAGKRQQMGISADWMMVKFQEGVGFEDQAAILKDIPFIRKFDRECLLPQPAASLIPLDGSIDGGRLMVHLKQLAELEEVEYAHPMLVDANGARQTYTREFMVRLRDHGDMVHLHEMARAYGVQIVRTNKHNPNIVHCHLTSEREFGLFEVVNAFEQSGHFEYVEPDFVIMLNLTGPTSLPPQPTLDPGDGRLDEQWHLINTGVPGTNQYNTSLLDADIDADSAWDITTGSPNITVAIVDVGV
ncbi:MAG: hypothetical protein AAF206_29465, partial [Bacteroidota bacterium]